MGIVRKISTGKAQPTELKSVTEHVEDDYALVIGFEVNEPEKNYRPLKKPLTGKVEKYHYVVDEPGHTFLYLVKNRKVTHFFSLGPLASQGGNQGSDLERMYGKGTPDYWIPGETKLFRFALNQGEYEALGKNITEERKKVLSGKKYYRVIGNYTCAATARDIIAPVWKDIPKGESYVILKGDRKGIEFGGGVRVVNPYALYEDLVNAGCKYRTLKLQREKWDEIMINRLQDDPYLDNGDEND